MTSSTKRVYSCWTAFPDPRGKTVSYWVQDGWRLVETDSGAVKVPHMIRHTSHWRPMSCGMLVQAGLTDVNCAHCANHPEKQAKTPA